MNTISDSINFCATINYERITKNKKRWGRIAKLFEESTKQYPNDKIWVKECGDRIEFTTVQGKDKRNKFDDIGIDGYVNKSVVDVIKKMPDSEIVKAIKRLFFIQRKANNMLIDDIKFQRKYGVLDILPDKKADELLEIENEFKTLYISDLISKDKFWKNFANPDLVQMS